MNKTELYVQIRESLPLDHLTDEEMEGLFFKSRNNIRLSYKGYRVMKLAFEEYVFPHNNDFLSKHLIAVSRDFTLPYFLSNSKLVVFSSYDATMIKLCGDVKTYLERLT